MFSRKERRKERKREEKIPSQADTELILDKYSV
jgi:hypothetical protein